MSAPRLGKVQLKILQVLWQRREATARQITDALNEMQPAGAAAVAHSTVQTLLRKMETKGVITHDVGGDGRAWLFRPLVAQNDVTGSVARDLLARVFGGSVSGLVAHLLKHETVAPDELARLRRLIDEAAARQQAEGEKSKEESGGHD